jgi:hypothetical protein
MSPLAAPVHFILPVITRVIGITGNYRGIILPGDYPPLVAEGVPRWDLRGARRLDSELGDRRGAGVLRNCRYISRPTAGRLASRAVGPSSD